MPEEVKYTTVTPVLSSTIGYLEDVRDQVASLVRWVIMNPGFTSSLWEDDLVSFRKIAAEYEGDSTALIEMLELKFSTIFQRMFKDYSVTPEFRAELIDPSNPNGKYRVIFHIVITPIEREGTTESALVTGTFTVDPDTYDITLNFTRSMDNGGLLI